MACCPKGAADAGPFDLQRRLTGPSHFPSRFTKRMSASIGSILQQEREIRGLSLGQVSEQTRIRESHLHELESDDFSNFANPAYARMYFRLYCKFLDIQLTDEIDLLFPGALAGLDDYEYLRNEPVAPPKRTPRPKLPRRSLAFLAAATLVILVVVALLGLSLAWTAKRVGTWGTEQYAQMRANAQLKKERAAAEALEAPSVDDSGAPLIAQPPAAPEDAAEHVKEAPAAVDATPETLGMGRADLGGLADPAIVTTDSGAPPDAAASPDSPAAGAPAMGVPPLESLGAPDEAPAAIVPPGMPEADLSKAVAPPVLPDGTPIPAAVPVSPVPAPDAAVPAPAAAAAVAEGVVTPPVPPAEPVKPPEPKKEPAFAFPTEAEASD